MTRDEAIERLLRRGLKTSVYCIWNVDRNAVKIGFSEDPKRRFKQIKTACCDRLVYWVDFPGGRVDESAWHESLAYWRMEGEWFDASDGLILKAMVEHALKMGGRVFP